MNLSRPQPRNLEPLALESESLLQRPENRFIFWLRAAPRGAATRLLPAVLLTVLASSFSWAQTVTVRGQVKDATGSTLNAASVKSYQGDQVAAEGQTNASGQFSLALPPGEYRIEVSAPNFATYSQTVTVQARMPALSVQLVLAPVQQSVNVQDQPYQVSLEPDQNLTGLVLTQQEVQDLPDNPDELQQLLIDLAGPGADAVGGATFSIDGFSGGVLPPREQIREIRINNNPFSAENDQSGRGRIEIVTRAGGDSLRGSFGFNFQDESLDGRNAFATSRPAMQERSWRSNLSGPLVHDKMSFSLSGNRSVQETSSIQNPTTLTGPLFFSVPTPNKRQEYSSRMQYNLPANNFLNLSVEYGTNSNRSLGGGGGGGFGGFGGGGGGGSAFTLPDRATQSNSNSIEVQIRETAPLTERLVDETRFQFSRDNSSTRSLNGNMAVTVLDAFEGGSADRNNNQIQRGFEFGNTLSYVKGKLSLKGGFQGNYQQYRTTNRDNFIGAFEFASLDNYAAGLPTKFTITRGNPALDMNQFQLGLFVQSDYRVMQSLMLSMGLRYMAQTNIGDKNNFDPRFGFAYGVGKNSVIRGGAGFFHQRLSAGNVQSILRLDGTRQIQTVLLYCQAGEVPEVDGCIAPSYPDPYATGATAASSPPSIRRMADNLALPYNINSSISFETRLPHGLFVSTSYNFIRGLHLYRSRNINAPLPGTDTALDPTYKNILLLESSASSRYHDISFQINQRLGRHSINFNYTLAKNYDDTNGATSTPANTYDLSGEWGPSNNNRKHTVFAGANIQLPWGVSSNLRIRANTGRPYTITTGLDDNHDTFTNDRPVGITRNTLVGPGFFSTDLSLRKTINLKRSSPAPAARAPAASSSFQGGPGGFPGGGIPGGGGGGGGGYEGERGGGGFGGPGGNNRARVPQMSISINATNLLNQTNLSRYSGVLTSRNFGKANSASSPREIQLGVQFTF